LGLDELYRRVLGVDGEIGMLLRFLA